MKTIAEYKQAIGNTLSEMEIKSDQIELDTDPAFGDFSTNIALAVFKGSPEGKWASPKILAEKLAEKLKAYFPDEEVSVTGPGFINFTLKGPTLMEQLEKMHANPLVLLTKENKKVLVEYSSPNIAKPFTVGHLRSTIIGEAIANLFEAKGYTVYRDNHLGDWGTQFGKLIYAIKTWGNLTEIESSDRPVKVLVDLYVKFHQEAEKNPDLEQEGRAWFAKLEKGDTEARALWKKCIDWSWKEFDVIYEELGCRPFTENNGRGYGESYFEDKMGPVIKELKNKELLKEGKEGAKIVQFPGDELPPLMILKKDGSTLYATRDLATDKFRLEKYGKDTVIINEVGTEQSLYFQQLFKLEEMLNWYKKGQRVHVGHGFFRLKEGKMSTRKGTVIWLEDVLKEAVERAKKLAKENINKNTADIVGIGALKWNDLKRSAHLDVVFDWDEVLNMEGNSGPYVQYAAVRCKSVLERSHKEKTGIPAGLEPNEEELKVLRKLTKFPIVIDRSLQEFAPHYLCTYLYELAQSFNAFYNKHQILNQDKASSFRLLLTKVVGDTLTEGLSFLGIQIPEKM